MSCHTQHGIVCHHVVPNSACHTLSCSVKFKWHSVSTHHVVSNSTWHTYSLSSCSVKLNMAQSVIMSCQTQHGTVCHHVLSDSTWHSLTSWSVKLKWHSLSSWSVKLSIAQSSHVCVKVTWHSLSLCSVKLNMAQSVIMQCQTQHGTVCHYAVSN